MVNDRISQCRVDGFTTIEGVLTGDQVQQLRAVLDGYIERSRQLVEDDDVFDLEPDHKPAAPRVRGLRDVLRFESIFDEITRSDAVLDVVERLIGPDIRRELVFVNMRPAGSHSVLEWHQDFAMLPYTNDDVVVCGLLVDAVAPENGALRVIPGSHRGAILDHHQDGVLIGAVSADNPELRADTAVYLCGPAGAMTVHHCRTLHATGPNFTAGPRRILFAAYAAADAYPVGKKLPLDDIDARLVRGSSTRMARFSAMTFRMPNRTKKADILFHLQSGLRKSAFAVTA